MAFDVSSIFDQQVKAVSKSDTGRELMQADIDDLVGNDANFYAVDEDKLEDLKNSIALSGIMDPPTVTPAENGKYRLISGHRRTAAVRALVAEGREDLRKVPVFVRRPKSAAMEELELIMANSTASSSRRSHRRASAKSGFTVWRAACPSWTRNLTAHTAAVRRQTGCKNGWTRSCARPAARILSRSASATRISENSITRRYHPGARKNDLDLWRGLLP